MACEYPIFLDMTGRVAVVVGAGTVAARKIDKLLGAGAHVRVVAREISDRVETMHAVAQQPPGVSGPHRHHPMSSAEGEIEVVRENFRPEHVAGAFLVLACTDNPDVNAEVIKAGRAAGALVNRVDSPADCDFITPAVTEHGPVKLAISTGGASPALAKLIRKQLNANLPKELGTLAELNIEHVFWILRDTAFEDKARVGLDCLVKADADAGHSSGIGKNLQTLRRDGGYRREGRVD